MLLSRSGLEGITIKNIPPELPLFVESPSKIKNKSFKTI